MELVENYKLNYSFESSNKTKVSNLLNGILNESNILFAEQLSNNQIEKENVVYEYSQMVSFIKNVEEYLYYYKDSPDFENVFNSISNIKRISVLPKNSRGIYGQAIAETHTLLINPDLRGSSTLTEEERTRLYVAHELGHFVNDNWMKSVQTYLDGKARRGEIEPQKAQLVYDGFSMLDEAITQNSAENFAYSFVGKTRPVKQSTSRGAGVYENIPYLTNFDFYGEFQTPASRFAKTLRGIGKYNDDQTALDILCTRALSPSFANDIINEYVRDGQFENLITLGENMGIIKNAVYTSFGGDKDYDALRKSGGVLLEFLNLADRMRDTRDPIATTGTVSRNMGQSGVTPTRVIHENANMDDGISLSRIQSLITQNERKPSFLARIIRSVKNKIKGREGRNEER
jgi:hypothetical protein